LEHFSYQDARDFLVKCNPISKIDALIRIIVTDRKFLQENMLRRIRHFIISQVLIMGFVLREIL